MCLGSYMQAGGRFPQLAFLEFAGLVASAVHPPLRCTRNYPPRAQVGEPSGYLCTIWTGLVSTEWFQRSKVEVSVGFRTFAILWIFTGLAACCKKSSHCTIGTGLVSTAFFQNSKVEVSVGFRAEMTARFDRAGLNSVLSKQ